MARFGLNPSTVAKTVTARVSLLALAATFELASSHVPEMREEISSWEDGRRIGIGVLPNGPCITLCKEGERVRYAGPDLEAAEVSLLFKNLDSAMMIFMARIGAAQAVVENRVIIHGDNAKAMQVTRAMAIVQTYLFPKALLRNTFKRVPRLGFRELARKALIMSSLPGKLLGFAFR